jgi:hypothetical protein
MTAPCLHRHAAAAPQSLGLRATPCAPTAPNGLTANRNDHADAGVLANDARGCPGRTRWRSQAALAAGAEPCRGYAANAVTADPAADARRRRLTRTRELGGSPGLPPGSASAAEALRLQPEDACPSQAGPRVSRPVRTESTASRRIHVDMHGKHVCTCLYHIPRSLGLS